MITEKQKQDIAALQSLAHQLGGTISINLSVPLASGEEVPGVGHPAREVATVRTVLWALNRLKAAPGQPNRDLVRKFLFVRGWLGPTQEPEQWNLEFVPVSKSELAMIISQVAQFEKDGRTPPAQ